MTASDPDLPPNAEPFKYRLVTGDRDRFSLDEDSGILLTKTSIDREEFNSFDLTIEVQDAGGLSSRSDLFIEVGDENDNPSKSRQVQVIIKNFEGTFPGNDNPISIITFQKNPEKLGAAHKLRYAMGGCRWSAKYM